MHRRIRALAASAVAVACLTFAAAAQASPSSFTGTVPNGGCDTARPVTVSGPSRIELEVSSSAASPSSVYGEILAPGGGTAATSRYDTPSGGTYGIRVCSRYASMNSPTLQYTVIWATGPAGQAALPAAAGVLAARATISHLVHGTGAIRTHAGLAWFTVKRSGAFATVRVLGPLLGQRYLYTRARIRFGTDGVRLVAPHMTLTLEQLGASERIVFRSTHLRASGWVVRGSFNVV